MSSPKAGPKKMQKEPRKAHATLRIPFPAVRCVNPTPCVFLTPVLVPYVPAPVQYVKTRSKKSPEVVTITPLASQKPRAVLQYVPAVYPGSPGCAPSRYLCDGRVYAAPVYCKPTIYGRIDGGAVLPNYPAVPLSTGDTNDALSQWYVSTVAPRDRHGEQKVPPNKSKLNPLSRPYTPPSRSRVCFCDNGESSTDDVWCCKARRSSRASTPDSWSDEVFSDAISRSASPDESSTCCVHQRKDLSDVDSGVEGESDDENWCGCACDKSKKFTCPEIPTDDTDEVIFPDLRHPRYNQETLSSDSKPLVDFVCSHLHSHEWRAVARELGVDDVIIQSVDYDVYENFREEMRYVFSYWVGSDEELPSTKRRRLLADALAEVGRSDLIEKLNSLDADD